jgi:hypothetical protein
MNPAALAMSATLFAAPSLNQWFLIRIAIGVSDGFLRR